MTVFKNALVDNEYWSKFIVELERVNKSVRRESDRGSIIVGAAIIEDNLRSLIINRLLPSQKENDELFDSYSPLGSFSAKIDMACRLGVVSHQACKSLRIIKSLRNDFAHNSDTINFKTSSVQDRIKSLFENERGRLDLIWIMFRKDKPGIINALAMEYDRQKNIESLLKDFDWRGVYDLLISLIATNLKMKSEFVTRIEGDYLQEKEL